MVRWDALFADMEQQLASLEAQGRQVEVAELTRAERTSVHLVDRFRGAVGAHVALVLDNGARVTGAVADVGQAWVLLEGQEGREHLVPVAAVSSAVGLGAAAPAAGPVLSRLGLGHALRALARDRGILAVLTRGEALGGRIDAVGGDHLDLALVHADSGRPAGRFRTVPFCALVCLSGG